MGNLKLTEHEESICRENMYWEVEKANASRGFITLKVSSQLRDAFYELAADDKGQCDYEFPQVFFNDGQPTRLTVKGKYQKHVPIKHCARPTDAETAEAFLKAQAVEAAEALLKALKPANSVQEPSPLRPNMSRP